MALVEIVWREKGQFQNKKAIMSRKIADAEQKLYSSSSKEFTWSNFILFSLVLNLGRPKPS